MQILGFALRMFLVLVNFALRLLLRLLFESSITLNMLA